MTDYETLTLSRDGAVARLAFNRQSTLNSMNTTMRRELLAAARELNLDDSIRIVELTGEGRAFGAGADLSEDDGQGGLMMGERTRDALINEFGPAVLAIADAPKVWVAAVTDLALASATPTQWLVILSSWRNRLFSINPLLVLGWCLMVVATWLTERLIGSRRALEMMVMGEKIPAAKALEWGMVNRVFADESFRQEAAAFLADLASRSPLALRYTKEALRYAATGLAIGIYCERSASAGKMH